MGEITSALTTSFTEIGSELTGIVGDVLPIVLPLVGGVIVVSVGVKIFKKVTSKA